MVLNGNSSKEYPVNEGGSQGSILGPTCFLLYINDLLDDVICNVAIYADDTTLYSKFDQASDLWQQLELASELESDLRDRFQIKRIGNVKCNLFFHYRDAKEISFFYFRDTRLCANHEKTHVNSC